MNKRIFIGTGLYYGAIMLITHIVSVVLAELHDLSYYYTWEGLKLAGGITIVEAIIIAVVTKPYFRKLMGDELFYKIFGEKEDEQS